MAFHIKPVAERTASLELTIPMTEGEYNEVNKDRAEDGLGPFLDGYANYLSMVDQANAARRLARLNGPKA